MASDVTMPRLSDSMEEGTILKWLVDEGGEVKRGEPLVEIETDKANMTYEADTDGTLIEVTAKEGDTLPVGELIARIGDAGEAGSNGAGKEAAEKEDDSGGEADEPSGAEEREEEPAEAPVATDEKQQRDESSNGAGAAPPGVDRRGDGRVKASPVARRMAQEIGIELSELEGSGPGGRIVKADVEAAGKGGERPAERGRAETPARPEPVAAGEAGAKGELQTLELTKLQRTVSRRMAESKATAPDFDLHVEVDMTACVELRDRLKEVADPVPSYNDMVVKACGTALAEHPRVNGAYRDGRFELYSRVNIGIAVAAQDTLVVPTIFDADRKSLGAIARDARQKIEKVRDGKITPPELSGGTFTVSNLGMYGIDSFSAVINPPQAALLTVGALKKKPLVDERGRVVARDAVSLTLTCDHRILYGADGAQFLARVRELLERPLSLAL